MRTSILRSLMVVAMILCGVGDAFGESIWSDSNGRFFNWDNLTIDASKFSTAEIADKIQLTFTITGDPTKWPQIALKNSSEKNLPGCGGVNLSDGTNNYNITTYSYYITSDLLKTLQSNGMVVWGYGFTLTDISLVKGAGSAGYENAVWIGHHNQSWVGLSIPASSFTNANVGDKLRLCYTDLQSDAKHQIRDGNWNEISGYSSDNMSGSYFEYSINQDLLDKMQSVGIIINGTGYCLTHVDVIGSNVYNITITTPTGGYISADKTTAHVGETVTLTATPENTNATPTWTITNTDTNANITADVNLQQDGNTATFTMPASNVTISAEISVKEPNKLDVTPTSMSLKIGETGNINATLTPNNAYRNIIYTSSNSTVAEVSSDGVVTAKAQGTATITVVANRSDNGTENADYRTQTVAVSVSDEIYTAQKVPTPVIKVRGNEVTFTCDEPDVTYYYTTNKDDPTTSSTQWNGNAITGLTNGTVIKVNAAKSGFAPSDVATDTFRTAHVVYLRLQGARGQNDGSSIGNEVGSWADAYAKLGFSPTTKYLRANWEASGYTSLSNHGSFTDLSDADFTSTVDNNIIYLVGDVSEDNFKKLFNVITLSNNNTDTYVNCQKKPLDSGVMKPATISGKFANNGFSTIGLPYNNNIILNEDVRFEYVKFQQGTNNDNHETNIMCGYYDFEFGDGVQVANVMSTATFNEYEHGYINDNNYRTQVPHILIYGGYVNDKRFTDMTGKELNFDKFLPHPDGFKITLHSGYLSTISPGGKQWDSGINGAMGSPNVPVKCTITIDVDHAWNKNHENGVLRTGTNCTSTVPNNDVSAIIAGTHQGNMYGDVEIIVKSGRVGRIVNGTLGANETSADGYPMDSYFGRAKILIDPREPSAAEVNAGFTDKNSMVVIQELYGGGLGRFKAGNSSTAQSATYFYGESRVIINGGTFNTALYASGAGGVNGIGDDSHHTNDSRLPYWNDSNTAYGNYSTYKSGTKLYVKCLNDNGTRDNVDLSLTNTRIEIHGGIFGSEGHPIDGIFGGGYGWVNASLINYTSSTISTPNNNYGNHKPNTQAGSIFAKAGKLASSIQIDGDAIIYGPIYGGGRGSDVYYNSGNSNITPANYNALGLLSGNVQLIIGGNAKIHGDVYGAGKGIDSSNLGNMAHLYGNTTLTIKENAEITGTIYGGGANGATEGTTTVNIAGGTVTGGVYGGGALANTGNATVNLTGGTVSGDVYGGGLGRTTDRAVAATVGTATVNVGSADGASVIMGSVYGCNNLNGYPTGAATVNIYNTADKGTETEENPYNLSTVFGGGNLASCSSNTIVNMNGGSVNVIYGGGSLANTGNTTVNLMGGTVGDVYGGGLGRQAADGVTAVAAEVGSTTVNIGKEKTREDGIIKTGEGDCVIKGSVFGCNNLNGTPTGDATVNVYKTNAQPGAADGAYHVYAVYGGGNKAAYDPEPTANPLTSCTKSTHVNIYTCNNSIQYVYGGGNAASTPATNVTIWGGKFDYVFGGGNGKTEEGQPTNPGANVGYYTDTNINDVTSHGDAYGSGKAQTSIHDGIINHLFGGSNTRGNIRYSAITQLEHEDCDFTIGEVYAAGNEAYMDGEAILNIGCIPGLGVIYGGARNAMINRDIQLTIKSGIYGKVFGGNNLGGTINGSITVNIEETGCNPVIIGEVYGGGNLAPYTTPTGKTGPTVNAYSFTQIGTIYGGGYGSTAVVTGDTHVNVNQLLGTPTGSVANPLSKPTALGIVGNIFGGGNEAKVDGNTYVNIGTAKTVTFKSLTTDNVKTVLGANIQPVTVTIPENITGVETLPYTGNGNVFGGGNNAEVTGKTNVVIGADKE